MTRTRTAVPRADVFHIGKIIEPQIIPDGEEDGEKRVKYRDGWNDERVATVSGVALANVRKIRQDLFGQLRRGGADNLYKRLGDRIDALEHRLAELEEEITKPRTFKSFGELGSANGQGKQ